MRKFFITLFTLFSLSNFAQIDLGAVFDGDINDARTLLKGYLAPAAKGFGNSINGGWYHTAKTHKLFGIDISVIASGALVPTEDETFTFNNADYNNIKLDNSSISSAEIPTIFGSQKLEDRPLLAFSDNGNSISASALPGSGLDIPVLGKAVPSPMIQAGVGFFFNTDIIVRFIPEQKDKEYEFSSFGFGFKHNIKKWIPFLKKLPFDMSVMAGWNDVKSKFFLDSNNNPTQAVELNTKTTTFQLLASKKFLMFTLFGGIGSASYTTDLNLLGSYKGPPVSGNTVVDPFKETYEGSSTRANIGLNMKLLFLNISAEYAKQEYDVVSIRAGFSIR